MVFSSAAHLDGMFIDMHNFHDMMQRLITSIPDLYCFKVGYLTCYHANTSNFDQVFCREYILFMSIHKNIKFTMVVTSLFYNQFSTKY